MSYYFLKTVEGDWEQTKSRVAEALKKVGLGIVTEIDMQKTLKEKLDADIQPYLILGACSPGFAHQAVQMEKQIGTMLPCNIVMQQNEAGKIEVSAVDPVASMQAIDNEELKLKAAEVQTKLRNAIDSL